MTLDVHGTALIVDGHGLLIRGPSGSGKSLLALLLLQQHNAASRTAWLVGDDRVTLTRQSDGLRVEPHKLLQGQIELRGRGLVSRPHAPSALVSLVIDLVPDLIRLPDPEQFETSILGLTLPRAPVPVLETVDRAHQILLIAEALAMLPPARQKTT
jgi:HPr kinase/phosphorylase